MPSSLILSVLEGAVSFGEKVIFDDLTFHIHEGDKICLVGRNGAGKSTLMNIITNAREMDSGKRWMIAGTRIGYLQQEIIPKDETVYDFVFEELKKSGEAELNEYKIDMIIQPLELDPQARMTELSGGQLRRACLARALVEEPDILLLDEPTNHLDLNVIEWLEKYLKAYRGAILCVSHDKAFLANISDKIFWLDRGRMKVCAKGFAHFDAWATEIIEQEVREMKTREKILEQEQEWAQRSPGARRKRNVRRLEIFKAARDKLKSDKGALKRMMAKIEVGDMGDSVEVSSKNVAEFIKVNKHFGGKKILENFNLRIQRGDRIGILGKNGSGKTSFLRLLVGELEPDAGKVKLARGLEFSYFDQKRKDLNYDDTIKQTLCPNGGDHLEVMGKTRHVCGYLKDFLFDPALVDQRVGTLSGGQKNRLMLARVLAEPKSMLILDEPTNDLDMDTLDMLEEILTAYTGTLLVVSHDRDFLDQTVTKILAFEGDAQVEGCIGGYTDYLAQQQGKKKPAAALIEAPKSEKKIERPVAPKVQKKLTYKLQYELENLPRQIARLEKEIEELQEILADSDLYAKDKNAFHHASHRLSYAREELNEAEMRWLELEEMRTAIG